MSDAAARESFEPSVPSRDLEGHKGTFGTVVVVGGACTPRWMPGAPCLAGRAAFRSGCGLVVLAVPRPLLGSVAALLPEATLLPLETEHSVAADSIELIGAQTRESHALVCGPGLGAPKGVETLVESVLAAEDRPRVLDADGLNALARLAPDGVRGPIILSPHPGEWSRLARAYGVDADPIDDEHRPMAAVQLARALDQGADRWWSSSRVRGRSWRIAHDGGVTNGPIRCWRPPAAETSSRGFWVDSSHSSILGPARVRIPGVARSSSSPASGSRGIRSRVGSGPNPTVPRACSHGSSPIGSRRRER